VDFLSKFQVIPTGICRFSQIPAGKSAICRYKYYILIKISGLSAVSTGWPASVQSSAAKTTWKLELGLVC
jgi:hypothetical protein